MVPALIAMDCEVCASPGDQWLRMAGHSGASGGDGFSHESENDLAAMVSDFLENGSLSATDSRSSSDSDSPFSDLAHLADKLSYIKKSMDQNESNLLSVVISLLLTSIKDSDLHAGKPGPCNSSCIKYAIVKLLRLLGYDSGVCSSKWPGTGKVPAGDHEYVDVITPEGERLVIDLNFRSHFEIARAVRPYGQILNSLPVVFVGSIPRLQQFLQLMVEAAGASLQQSSMPLPPWRSYAYLLAKWGSSPYQRKVAPEDEDPSHRHVQCGMHLKQLKSSLQSEIEAKRLFRPMDKRSRNR